MLVVATTLGSLLCGCADQKGPPILIQVAGSATNETCGGDNRQLSTLQPTKLRLTVLQHSTATDPTKFLCDRIVTFPEQPFLKLGGTSSGLDFWVEAFAPDAKPGSLKRLATGALYNVDRTTKTSSTVRLLPSAQFACASGNLTQGRAFHSATKLSNGEVLIVGGAVAGVDPARVELDNFQLFATGSIEVYDPVTSKMVAVNDSAPNPRAFHQAVVLSDAPPYQILLVGGLAASSGPILKLSTDPGEGTRFYPRDSVFSLFPTKAVAAELLTYDPTTHTVTHSSFASVPTAALQAIARIAGNTVITGGIDYTGNPNSPVDAAHAKDLLNGTPMGAGVLASDTAGGALALLSNDPKVSATLAVVFGGARLATPGGGQLLAGIGTASPTATAFAAGGKAVRFPTLSLVSRDSATATLVTTGGFEVLGDGSATQPLASASSAQIVTVNGTTAAVAPAPLGSTTDCGNNARYRAAGWESATVLSGGRVLITGGAPSTVECGGNCENGQTGNLALSCSLHQSSLFENGMLALTTPMGIARAGHALTPLDDGSVLVTGGLQSTTSVARMVREVEIYNPRRVVPPWDASKPSLGDADDPVSAELLKASVTRAPGELAIDANGKPAAKCDDL